MKFFCSVGLELRKLRSSVHAEVDTVKPKQFITIVYTFSFSGTRTIRKE